MKKTDKEIIAGLKARLSEKNRQIENQQKSIDRLWKRIDELNSAFTAAVGIKKYYTITYKAFNQDKTLKSEGIKGDFDYNPMPIINKIRDALYHWDSFELIKIEVIDLNV